MCPLYLNSRLIKIHFTFTRKMQCTFGVELSTLRFFFFRCSYLWFLRCQVQLSAVKFQKVLHIVSVLIHGKLSHFTPCKILNFINMSLCRLFLKIQQMSLKWQVPQSNPSAPHPPSITPTPLRNPTYEMDNLM